MTIIDADIKVRAKKRGTVQQDTYGSSASVCAGGVDSNAHIAEIEITTSPATQGMAIYPLISGGVGVNHPASLNMDAQTNSEGKIYGELISSDLIESVTLYVGTSGMATVSFDDNMEFDEDSWTCDPEYLSTTNDLTLTLIHHGEPVVGHNIKFIVGEMYYMENEEEIYTDDLDFIDDYESFSPAEDETDSTGEAATTLSTSTELDITAVVIYAIDQSIFLSNVSPNMALDPADMLVHPTYSKDEAGGILYLYQKSVPGTDNMIEDQVLPEDYSLVSTNHEFKFLYVYKDSDARKKELADPYTKWDPFADWIDYQVEIYLTNAIFPDINDDEKTVNLKNNPDNFIYVPGGLIYYDVIKPTNANNVKVFMHVNDRTTIPLDKLKKDGNGNPIQTNDSLQDGELAVDPYIEYEVSDLVPEWIKTSAQAPPNMGDEVRNDTPLILSYKVGTGDENNPPDPDTDLAGCTIKEEMTDYQFTTPLNKEWIRLELLADPALGWGDKDIAVISEEIIEAIKKYAITSSFTVQPGNIFTDYNQGTLMPFFNKVGENSPTRVVLNMKHKYFAANDTLLDTYNLNFIFKGGNPPPEIQRYVQKDAH